VSVDADTWLEEDQPKARHGSDAQLLLASGTAERRALFSLTLPGLPSGAMLKKATFVLHLEADADTSKASRELTLRRLQQSFDEKHASWLNYANGKATWAQPGGDFGAALAAPVTVAPSVSNEISFDVGSKLDRLVGGQPPTAVADLARNERITSGARRTGVHFERRHGGEHTGARARVLRALIVRLGLGLASSG
jgi:hypothetical protein